MILFETIDGKRLGLDLLQVEAVMEREHGTQIITRGDTYMVKRDFVEVFDMVERAQEGKA